MSEAAITIIDGEISRLEGQISKLRQARALLAGKQPASTRPKKSRQLALPAPERGQSHEYEINGKDIPVTLRQKQLLDALMAADEFASTAQLLKIFGGNRQSLFQSVHAVNKACTAAGCGAKIENIRGKGYRLQDTGGEA